MDLPQEYGNGTSSATSDEHLTKVIPVKEI